MNDRPTMGFWNGVIIWHTDERGNFHWGNPSDRLARMAWEEDRRMQAGAEERARQEPKRDGSEGMRRHR